ncbi:MAG: class I SAM-dependent methyltransferase [Alphaproteobacteria bacterium]
MWLKAIIGHIKQDRVLETGCGNGVFLKTFQDAFSPNETVGLDFSSEAIHIGKHLFENDITFVQSDVAKMPFEDNHFSTTISLGLIEHFDNPFIPLEETLRVLNKDGILILMTPNKYSFGVIERKIKQLFGKWNFGYQKEYSTQELEDLLKKKNMKIFHSSVQQRIKSNHETKSMFFVRIIDNILSKFSKKYGFYSWVIAIKEE